MVLDPNLSENEMSILHKPARFERCRKTGRMVKVTRGVPAPIVKSHRSIKSHWPSNPGMGS